MRYVHHAFARNAPLPLYSAIPRDEGMKPSATGRVCPT